MGILSTEAKTKLIENGNLRLKAQQAGKSEPDFMPVVRVFMPAGFASWLLTELDPECSDIAFGLCDLGHGFPELGSVSITEIEQVQKVQNLPIQQDEAFAAQYPLSVYARAAHRATKITLDKAALELAAGNSTDEEEA